MSGSAEARQNSLKESFPQRDFLNSPNDFAVTKAARRRTSARVFSTSLSTANSLTTI
jgi:hypothetical protein